jgi:hypothetical protein
VSVLDVGPGKHCWCSVKDGKCTVFMVEHETIKEFYNKALVEPYVIWSDDIIWADNIIFPDEPITVEVKDAH